MEDFISEQPQELSVRCGELVHILTKSDDGRWHCFVSQGQVNILLNYHVFLFFISS